jgi:RHS repeat-associated protein
MVTRSEYGSTGQIRRSSEPFTIDRTSPAGHLPRAALPANQIPRDKRTTYDALGRVVLVEQIHSAAGSSPTVTSEQTTEYSGWTTTVHPATKPGESTPYASTRSTVDAFGQTTAVTRLAKGSTPSSTTNFEYDKLGRKAATVNPQTGRTELLYNTAGWVRRIDDEHTGATTFSYYPNGSVAESENARNHTIEYTLDWRGRTTQVARANGELIATYAYDRLSDNTVQYGVTTFARSYPDGVSSPFGLGFEARTLAVDSMGRVTRTSSRVFPLGLTATPPVDDVEWNTLTTAHEFTTRFTRSGTAWSATLPAVAEADGAGSAETVTTEFGPTGVPLSTNTSLDSGAYSVVEHDEIGRLVSEVLGGSGTGIGVRRDFEFQPSTGRLSRATSTIIGSGAGVLSDREIQKDNYVYDVVGNIVRLGHDPDGPEGAQLAAEDEVECFYYDPASRLVGGYGSQRVNGDLPSCVAGPSDIPGIHVEGVTYRERTAFNPSGTISAHRAADYNYATSTASPAPSGCNAGVTPSLPSAAKAVGGDVAESYRYDCSGNLIQTRDSSGTVLFDYSWDNSGRLAQVIDRRSGAARTSRFRYDPAGQRVAKVDPDGAVTVYLGGTEMRYDPGKPAGGRLSVARSYGSVVRGHDGRVSFVASNHQGSNTAALVVGGGAAPSIGITRYRPYGEIREGEGVNDRAFLNQVHDADIGLHYLNARYYNPAIGQFISVDPLVESTLHPYLYGDGNPIGLSDPTGLEPGCNANDSGSCANVHGDVEDAIASNQYKETVGDDGTDLNTVLETLELTNGAAPTGDLWKLLTELGWNYYQRLNFYYWMHRLVQMDMAARVPGAVIEWGCTSGLGMRADVCRPAYGDYAEVKPWGADAAGSAQLQLFLTQKNKNSLLPPTDRSRYFEASGADWPSNGQLGVPGTPISLSYAKSPLFLGVWTWGYTGGPLPRWADWKATHREKVHAYADSMTVAERPAIEWTIRPPSPGTSVVLGGGAAILLCVMFCIPTPLPII